MEPTIRLYFTNSSLLDFRADVLEVRSSQRGVEVVLDQTAFYPTGGGQPNDTGRLDEAEVIDVYEDEAGAIFHVIKEAGLFAPGQTVSGQVNPERRLEHMQQHSGQHILSQAFVKSCGAETRSFHLGAQTSTIDVELEKPTDDLMRAAEDLANEIVFEDRPMRIHIVNENDAVNLPLRKESVIQGEIRVIEVEDFDWSPCGGTHASRTGQIGLIAIRSYERAKKMTRVEFVCGGRALDEYRHANRTAAAVAQTFSAERDSAPELVTRIVQENKLLKKRLRDLLELAMKAEAAERLSQARSERGFKIVSAIFDDREAEELRVLAAKIVKQEPAIALLGTRDSSAARLVFARSDSLEQNMGELLSESCQILGGRGGGRSDLAQGGGPRVSNLEEALAAATDRIAGLAAAR
jgi:alanyl-tRNA synthetase